MKSKIGISIKIKNIRISGKKEKYRIIRKFFENIGFLKKHANKGITETYPTTRIMITFFNFFSFDAALPDMLVYISHAPGYGYHLRPTHSNVIIIC